MTRAENFRIAAELIDDRQVEFSCSAITVYGTWSARESYAEFFKPDPESYFWAGQAEHEWGRKGRVLALCFAAAMAESGDL